jgi:hypothetical protein
MLCKKTVLFLNNITFDYLHWRFLQVNVMFAMYFLYKYENKRIVAFVCGVCFSTRGRCRHAPTVLVCVTSYQFTDM